MERIDQGVAKRVPLKAYLTSDHISPATGKTIPVVISKNGAAFGNPNAGATNATAIANGWYYVDLDATDTGTVGPLIVRGTEGTIDDTEIAFSVEAAKRDTLLKNTASQRVVFRMFDVATYQPLLGLVNADFLVKTVALDTAAPSSIAGSVTEIGGGYYYVNLSQAETNATDLAFAFEASGVSTNTGFTVRTLG